MEALIQDVIEYINDAIRCAMMDPAATLLVFMLLVLVIITPGRKVADRALMALTICFIYLILTSNVLARTYIFETRRKSFQFFTGDGYEMLENILLFTPLGMLLCGLDLKTKPTKPWKNMTAYRVIRFFISMAFAGLFTCVIEILQYYLQVGVFTVDDILCNTTGAVAGYGLIFLVVFIAGRVRKGKAASQASDSNDQ